MKPAALILFPFAVLFDAVTRVRNRMYDLGLKASASFDIPVISVGNLAVGGTGKTPMIEHLVRLLSSQYQLAVLSRGYKRKTKGFRLAGPMDTAVTIGDEPLQLYKKFGNKIIVSVGEERAIAIPQILQESEHVECILLDDAFQHRKVRPSFQILLTDYNRPFYSDLLLPLGRLRESKEGAKRADVVVVTKCPPSVSDEEMITIQTRIALYSKARVFFAGIRYGELTSFAGVSGGEKKQNVVLVTGLANAQPLYLELSKVFHVVKHFDFADHFTYSVHDIQSINAFAATAQAMVVTSEKDAVKLEDEKFRDLFEGISWFYLPMEIAFVKNGKDFDAMVLNEFVHAKS